MTPKQTANIAEFVLSKLPEKFLHKIITEDSGEHRVRVFPWALTLWLMICQRFARGESLAAAVDRLREGECDRFLEEAGASKLVRSGRISGATGGYSQARKRLPLRVIEQAIDYLNGCIDALHDNQQWQGRRVYLVDGSSLTLPHSKEILKVYPACHNQYGKSHWPVIRTCHAHNLMTGVALRPTYGPFYGERAVSETKLFLTLLERLPTASVIVGDRLYGSFRIAYESAKRGHEVLLRFTKDRARPFLAALRKPGELTVKDWQTGLANRTTRLADLPGDATISGRFIWYKLRRKGFQPVDLYLFTTLPQPAAEIVDLYARRWNIETDIRSLKCCLNLDEISSKTADMVHKEIILAHAAYNLVRHVAAIAADAAGVDPRRVSFKRVLNFITFAGPRMIALPAAEQVEIIDRFVDQVVPQILNHKRNRPPEPRKVLPRRRGFPLLRRSRASERKALTERPKNPN